MATHSSVLAWRIPGMGEPGGLPSMGSHSWTRLKQLCSSSSKDFQCDIEKEWLQRTFLPISKLRGKFLTIPQEKEIQKAKWLFEEALQIVVKRRDTKSKGEKERYKHLNAEFQRIARRDMKASVISAKK